MLSENSMLKPKLESALKFAKVTGVLGSSNKFKDVKDTDGWSSAQIIRYFGPNGYRKSFNGERTLNENERASNSTFDAVTKTLVFTNKYQWNNVLYNDEHIENPEVKVYPKYRGLPDINDPNFLKRFNLDASHGVLLLGILWNLKKEAAIVPIYPHSWPIIYGKIKVEL